MKDATSDLAPDRAWWRSGPQALIGAGSPPTWSCWTSTRDKTATRCGTSCNVPTPRSSRDVGITPAGATAAITTGSSTLAGSFDRRPKAMGAGQRRRSAGRKAVVDGGIDMLHHGHRYTILPPSPHPDDRQQPYEWDVTGAPGPDAAASSSPCSPPTAPTRTGPPGGHAARACVHDRVGDSIADWFTDHHTWTRSSSRPGGRSSTATATATGRRGGTRRPPRRPRPAIRHGCLFVYSRQHRLRADRGRRPARLHEVPGVGRARPRRRPLASRHARHGELKDGRVRSTAGDPSRPDVDVRRPAAAHRRRRPTRGVHGSSPVAICRRSSGARPELGRIRQAAHARARSADAVLGAVLARVSMLHPADAARRHRRR